MLQGISSLNFWAPTVMLLVDDVKLTMGLTVTFFIVKFFSKIQKSILLLCFNQGRSMIIEQPHGSSKVLLFIILIIWKRQ